MKDRGEFIFGVFIFGTIAGFTVLSLGYSPTARLVPLIVGIAGIIFILLQLMSHFPKLSDKLAILTQKKDFFSTRKIKLQKIKVKSEEIHDEADADQSVDAFSEKEMFFWVLLFSVSIFLFGFLISVPSLIGVYLRYRADASWRFTILSALGIEFVMYFGFVYLLEVFLYKGYIFILIMGR